MTEAERKDNGSSDECCLLEENRSREKKYGYRFSVSSTAHIRTQFHVTRLKHPFVSSFAFLIRYSNGEK